MPEAEGDLNKSIDWVVSLITRRRWWIMLSTCASALATATVLSQLPNRYTSEATMLAVQPQVSERYGIPMATTDTATAVQAMMQDALSRARLIRIMDELGLYKKDKDRLAPQ